MCGDSYIITCTQLMCKVGAGLFVPAMNCRLLIWSRRNSHYCSLAVNLYVYILCQHYVVALLQDHNIRECLLRLSAIIMRLFSPCLPSASN